MKKRILSFLVALAFCLGLLPTAALAADSSVRISSVTLENGKLYVADSMNGIREKTEDDPPDTPYLEYQDDVLTVHGEMEITTGMAAEGNLTINGDENAALTISYSDLELRNGILTLDGGVDFNVQCIAASSSEECTLTTTEDYSGDISIVADSSAGGKTIDNVILDLKSSGSVIINGTINEQYVPMTLKSSGDVTFQSNSQITNSPFMIESENAEIRTTDNGIFWRDLIINARNDVSIVNKTFFITLGSLDISAQNDVLIRSNGIPIMTGYEAGGMTVRNAKNVSIDGETDNVRTAFFLTPATFENCGKVSITDSGDGALLAGDGTITTDCPCIVKQEGLGKYSVIMPDGETWAYSEEGFGIDSFSDVYERICYNVNGGWAYYEPAAGGNPARLTLDGVTYNDDIDCGNVETVIVARGENTIEIIKSEAPVIIEKTNGELNAVVTIIDNDARTETSTVYGNAVLVDEEFYIENKKLLTIPSGTSLTIDEDSSFRIEDPAKLTINPNARLVNNGEIILRTDETAFGNISEYIKSLGLSGSGMVYTTEPNGSGGYNCARAYSNSGKELIIPTGGTLDVSTGGDSTGDGYVWDSTTKTLTLAEGFYATKVTIPDDRVTIVTQGEATIGTLTTPDDPFGGGPSPQNTKLALSGTGTLTFQDRLELSGGRGNCITVAQGANVIAEKGLAGGIGGGVDFSVTVDGHLTAYSSGAGSAIYAGKTAIGGTGVLEVYGIEGVFLGGMDGSTNYSNLFTITGDGRFTADCSSYNLMVGTSGSDFPAGTTADGAIALGEEYQPDDCVAKKTLDSQIDLVRLSTDQVFTGPLTIHRNHDYSGEWEKDDANHWKVCTFTGCGRKDQSAAHDWLGWSHDDDNHWRKCSICGQIQSAAHDWSNWSHDDSTHWRQCRGCGESQSGLHVYDDGQDTVCNTCGYTRTVAPSHTHVWSMAWSNDNSCHWRECTVPGCGLTDSSQKGDYGAHVYDDEQDTACNICGYTRTVTVLPDSPSSPSSPSASGSSGGRKAGSVSTYRVIVKQADHGEISSDRDRASAGSTVILTVDPNNGYALDTLTVTDGQGNALRLTEQEDGRYTFTMPASDVTASAAFAPLPTGETDCPSRAFPDLDVSDWYHEAVDFVLERGLMSGTNAGFAPNAPLSRAMLAQILWNHAGKPAAGRSTFPDVPASEWYAAAIDWASETGIVSGYGDGRFGPNDSVTREQFAVMLWRCAGSPVPSGAALNFSDADKISPYALTAIRWAVENGILSGAGSGQLAPQGLATRAQAAQMLKNYIKD